MASVGILLERTDELDTLERALARTGWQDDVQS
jgi:hypothetical protein